MASSPHEDEDWLDVAHTDTDESFWADSSILPVRDTTRPKNDSSIATSKSPTLDGGIADMISPEQIKPTSTHIDANPLYQAMRNNADLLLKSDAPIFRTDLDNDHHVIRKTFNNGLPLQYQQEFNCGACHRFMTNFGDLAMVDSSTGNLKPIFWNSDSQIEFFHESAEAVFKLFEGKKVRNEFRVMEKRLEAGTAEAGGFTHMSFKFPQARLQAVEPRGFASAATVELAEMLDRVLSDNRPSTIHEAAELLLHDKLPYAEKHKGAVRWLRDLLDQGQLLKAENEVKKHNLLYLAAADSFLGCIHQLRSGVISTLFKEIELGLPFPHLKERWCALVNPIAYMRPTALPSAGNIAAAEKLFAEIGLTKDDLRRKYLLMENVPQEVFMYKFPTPTATKPEGIFSNLASKVRAAPSSISKRDDPSIPPTSLTFATFINTVLSTAQSIEYEITIRPPLHFLITGLPGTNPLMQWHKPANLASNYTYYHPRRVEDHNLTCGWTKVSAIIPFPELWEGAPATCTFPLADELMQPLPDGDRSKMYKHGHHGWRYLVCLDDVEDQNNHSSCLFPTLLRKELHGVRSTIEAYSESHGIERVKSEGPIVGGISVDKAVTDEVHKFRVRDQRGRVSRYNVVLFQ